MFIAISWFVVLVLLGIWSLSVWVLHSFMVWSMSGVGALGGQPRQIDGLVLPDAITLWIPPDLMATVKSAVAMGWPLVESSLAALPSIAGWLAPLAWGVWGIGFLTLAVIGAVLHALIFATQKAARG